MLRYYVKFWRFVYDRIVGRGKIGCFSYVWQFLMLEFKRFTTLGQRGALKKLNATYVQQPFPCTIKV